MTRPIGGPQAPASLQKSRVLELQRQRRAGRRRIDYYPGADVAAVIDGLRTPYIGGDTSSVIDRIVREWAAR